MFERRHFTAGVVPTAGSPLVLDGAPRARRARGRSLSIFTTTASRSIAREWTYDAAVLAGHRRAASAGGPDDHARRRGRARSIRSGASTAAPSSDDKSPIVAFLAAIDALDAQGASPLTSNVRILLEGEEEAGSPNLAAAVREHADRIRGDALILVDGPRHASGRATMNFGARGLMAATITVYGARATCTAATTATGRRIRRSIWRACWRR